MPQGEDNVNEHINNPVQVVIRDTEEKKFYSCPSCSPVALRKQPYLEPSLYRKYPNAFCHSSWDKGSSLLTIPSTILDSSSLQITT
jgi:hypothetical protein